MGVQNDGKWFSVDPVDAPVAAAAAEILAIRLADVQERLPAAARRHRGDIEPVHQLRVSCRRAAAALRAFDSLAGRHAAPLDKWLKRIRRAAGPARDADVLLARLDRELASGGSCGEQVIRHIKTARMKAQRRLADADIKADGGGLERSIKKCINAVRKSHANSSKESFAEFALGALTSAAHDLPEIDAVRATFAELHKLRIAAKRLRYSIELFHSAADQRVLTSAYPLVEETQERLGALNDHVAAQQRFQQWLAKLPPDELAGCVAGLIVSEQAAAMRLRHEFLAWWLPARRAALKDCLSTALS